MVENFKVGTRVRSYDFAGVTDHYVEGRIVAIVGDTYRIQVDTIIRGGVSKPTDGALIVCPPLNGLQGLGGLTRGVTYADQRVTHAAHLKR